MRKISNPDLDEQRFNLGARPSDSRDTIGAPEERPSALRQSSENKARHDPPQEVDPRIFSRVYSHIARNRCTSDTGVLVDLIWAISLDRSAFYFETLQHLEPRTRDLGLELVKAKLCGAFPREAWEDAHRFANELNQGTNAEVSSPSPTAHGGFKEQSSTPRVAQDSKREARQTTDVFGIAPESAGGGREASTATTVKRANFEMELGRETRESGKREHRRFRRSVRTALAYASQYGGFNGFKYLWGAAAAAATVIGLFALVVALDERVLNRRFEMFASWFSEPVESPAQTQEPVLAEVNTTKLAAPPGETPQKAVPPEQSSLPSAELDLVTEKASSVGNDKIAIAPPLAGTTESAVPADSSLAEDVPPLTPPSEGTSVEQGGPATSEPPKPIQRAVPKKAKSDKTRLKPAKPSLAKRSAVPPKPPTVETEKPVGNLEQPKAPLVAKTPAKPTSENTAPSVAAAQPTNEAASESVEKTDSDPVAVPARFEPVRDTPQPREKVVANPSFVERLMGFKPGERIARIQPGRRATQPDFIRQLENVEGPAKHAEDADVETK